MAIVTKVQPARVWQREHGTVGRLEEVRVNLQLTYTGLSRPCLAPFPSSFLVNNADPFTRLISSLIEYAP